MKSQDRPSAAQATRAGQDVIAAIGRLRRAILHVASDETLSAAQTSVIALLGKNGAATASALAGIEGVRPQSMTTTLAALDGMGFIDRHADPNDGRRQIITLSRAGEAQFNGARSARHAWVTEQIRTTLTPEETRTLVAAAELMQRLARS